ncbi:MAG TPA: hypothetical protein DIS82_01040 [Exiguobacterium sp.]|uniref:hypothetical protein n=1 Tax=Exiguobacterium sp. TaxID=44751 RepID=UPI000EE53B34|nr:hypothetical protein [Exiguobacterium sp.]HCN56712.1 hypothetical protein [Exiguobacterium sp.]
MKKQLIFILLSSICLTAGCARETETISTTDIIAKEARQDQSADLIRVQDRVYKRSGKDMTIAKKDLVAITIVQKQLSGKEALADRTATDWPKGTELYQSKDSTGELYVFQGTVAYRYEAIAEG